MIQWNFVKSDIYEAQGGKRIYKVYTARIEMIKPLMRYTLIMNEYTDPDTGEITNRIFKQQKGKFTFKTEESLLHHLTRGRNWEQIDKPVNTFRP